MSPSPAPSPDTRTLAQRAADDAAAAAAAGKPAPKAQRQTLEQHVAAGNPAGTYPLPGYEETDSPALLAFQTTGVVPAEVPRKRRKVVATQVGYYGHIVRQRGDVFVQDDAVSAFSKKWMRGVAERTPEKVTGPNAVIAGEAERLTRERLNKETASTSVAAAPHTAPTPDPSDPIGDL